MQSSYILWIVLGVLLVAAYIWSALGTPNTTVIVQTSVEAFRSDLLNEKNPILVQDQVVDLDEFFNIAFKWVRIQKITNSDSDEKKTMNSYLVFWPSASTIITIQRPGGTPVDVRLPAQNILILPMFWKYKCTSENVNVNVFTVNTIFGQVARLF